MDKIVLSLLFVCAVFISQAKTSWDALIKNDYPTAEKELLKALGSDSSNVEALVGLIYLAETRKDQLSYDRYVTLLSKKAPSNEVYFAFANKNFDKSFKDDAINTLFNINQDTRKTLLQKI
ncbi:MAG: hypothetical protein LRY27_02060 [Chitinophagales bacterium]|nr:hypothetical protein [Chitinophagales bacterium]